MDAALARDLVLDSFYEQLVEVSECVQLCLEVHENLDHELLLQLLMLALPREVVAALLVLELQSRKVQHVFE